MEGQSQYSGPTTTANSEAEGRLKVDMGQSKKRKILKKNINNYKKKSDILDVTRIF